MFSKLILVIGYIATVCLVGRQTGIIRNYKKITNNTTQPDTPSNVQHVHHYGMNPWFHNYWYYPMYTNHHETSWSSNSKKKDDEDDEMGLLACLMLIIVLCIITACSYTSYQELYIYSPTLFAIVLAVNTISALFVLYDLYIMSLQKIKKEDTTRLQIILFVLSFTTLSGLFAVFNPVFIIYIGYTLPIMVKQILFT
jgi:hypothetical protein